MRSRAGGKGLNVARVLASLGHQVTATGLLGGPTGSAITADLSAADLSADLSADLAANLAAANLAAGKPASPNPSLPANPPADRLADQPARQSAEPQGDLRTGRRTDPASTGFVAKAGFVANFVADFVPIAGESRRTVAVLAEDGTATLFNEPGPVVTKAEWAAFRDHFTTLVTHATVVVLAGSLPPGVPVDAYAQLLSLATRTGARTVLDTSGPALSAGLAGHPDVVKPNAAELHAATGLDQPLAAARSLPGAGAVVASLGPDGLLAVAGPRAWRATPPAVLSGNPTGAGDACVAALAIALTNPAPLDWPTTLAEAVALSAAAVATPLAGEIDLATYHRLRPAVLVEELAC